MITICSPTPTRSLSFSNPLPSSCSVPCRHTLGLRIYLRMTNHNIDPLGAQDFAPQWLVNTEAERLQVRFKLFLHVPAPIREGSATGSGEFSSYTNAERIQAMVNEARMAATLCAREEELTRRFRTLIKDLYDQASGSSAPGTHVSLNPPSKRAQKAAAAGAAAAGAAAGTASQNPVRPATQGRKRKRRVPNVGQDPKPNSKRKQARKSKTAQG